MGKKTEYRCSECGYISLKWLGKCPNCDSWGTIEEEAEQNKKILSEIKDVDLLNVDSIEMDNELRYLTNYEEFDRVLGGGLIKGSVTLITGNPGIGKSTILLQLLQEYSKIGKTLYVSGEESTKQIKQRSDRLNIKSKSLFILNETNVNIIEGIIKKEKPKVVVIDSIQTLSFDTSGSLPGSVSQVRETCHKIIEIAKSNDISFFVVGHVTKDGKVAGPKLLEHMVDTVIQIEGEEDYYYRIIRSVKNRYGSTNEIAIFDMKESGMEEVKNPSEFFLSDRDEKNIGSVIAPIIEGSRVFLFEIQTLLTNVSFGIPRIIVQGYDKNRVEILSAILSRTLSMDLNLKDIFVNIPGGISLKDRSSDLAVLFSLVSSIKEIEISQKIAAIGELGLRGELRKVAFIKKRIVELEKLGFKGVYLPKSHKQELSNEKFKIKLIYLKNIKELLERVNNSEKST